MSFFEFPHTRTYDSDLGWLIKHVEKLINDENSFQTYVTEWINTHEVDYSQLLTRVNLLESEMTKFEEEMNTRFDSLQSELTAYIYAEVRRALSEIIAEVGDIRAAIIQLRTDVQREIIETNATIQAHDDVLREWIELRLQQFIEEIPDLTTVNVWNPIKGAMTSINVAVADLYNMTRSEAITASEYDSLNLEAEDYDNLLISAFDYDNYARTILGRWGIYKNPQFYMYSPFTGEYVTITSVINQLASFHLEGAITAENYDLKELTATTYDALELTAIDYDMRASHLLP